MFCVLEFLFLVWCFLADPGHGGPPLICKPMNYLALVLVTLAFLALLMMTCRCNCCVTEGEEDRRNRVNQYRIVQGLFQPTANSLTTAGMNYAAAVAAADDEAERINRSMLTEAERKSFFRTRKNQPASSANA